VKGRVFAIRASIVLVMSTFIFIFFDFLERIISLFLGIGSSAVVTLVVYAVEYSVVKVRTLENLWLALYNVNTMFNDLKYLFVEEPIELIGPLLRDSMFDGTNSDAGMKALADWYIEQFERRCTELSQNKADDEIQRLGMDKVRTRLDTLIKEIEETIGQYIQLKHNMDRVLREVENEYGETYFLMCNAKKRTKVFQDLIKPHQELLNALTESAFDLELCIRGRGGNLHFALHRILELQEKIFRVEKWDDHIKVYYEYYDRMSETLEKFRASIYGCEPNLQRRRARIMIFLPGEQGNDLSD